MASIANEHPETSMMWRATVPAEMEWKFKALIGFKTFVELVAERADRKHRREFEAWARSHRHQTDEHRRQAMIERSAARYANGYAA